jgi:hypothetical protein
MIGLYELLGNYLHTLDDNFLFGFCKYKTLNHKFQTECGSWQNINLFIYMTDHGQATGKLYHLRLRVVCTLFVIYKAGREPTPHW